MLAGRTDFESSPIFDNLSGNNDAKQFLFYLKVNDKILEPMICIKDPARGKSEFGS